MRHPLPVWLATVVIVASCSSNYKVPERSAMSAFPVPLYDGLPSITSGTSFKSLTPGTLVYTTDDTLTVNDKKFVKITWADSTGYAPINQMLPQGRLVIIASDVRFGEIPVYAEPAMSTELFEFPYDWMMVVAGPQQATSTPVMYRDRGSDALKIGYLNNAAVLTDSLNLEFFRKYIKASELARTDNTSNALDELKNDTKYQSLTAWLWRFGDTMPYGENQYADGAEVSGEGDDSDENYGDYFEGAEGGGAFDQEAYDRFTSSSDWIGVDGETPLTQSEIPGTIKKYFVLETGAVIDADGLWILNEYPDGRNLGDDAAGKIVTEVRFEFTAAKDVSINMEVEIWDTDLNYARAIAGEQFEAEAGKSYTMSVRNSNGEAYLCSVMRMTAATALATTSSVVSAECGD